MKQTMKTGKYAGCNIKKLPLDYLLKYEKWYLKSKNRKKGQLVLSLFVYEYKQIKKELNRRGKRRRTIWHCK